MMRTMHLCVEHLPARPGKRQGTSLVIAPLVPGVGAGVLVMADVAHTTRFSVLLPEEGRWQITVQQLLQPQGVQTLVARTGRDALRIMEEQPVHAAVIPQDMPSLNGLQVIRRMNELAHRPPAILLANRMTNHLLQEALGMHVFSVLSEPVDLNLLLDTLARLMRRFYESRWPSPPETPGHRSGPTQPGVS
jgi:DNA-binding response OmpR family regulator